jgi:hypothetical protein
MLDGADRREIHTLESKATTPRKVYLAFEGSYI